MLKTLKRTGIRLALALFLLTHQGNLIVCAAENVLAEDTSKKVQISAPSAVLMEASTGEIIYEKNADERRSPASITKIMTLLDRKSVV